MLPDWELLLRLALAAILGSAIGIERERLIWAAGLRTHMLVSVGACLFMIVSAYGFAGVLGTHVILDPSRVAAQVVSGVGFLGAGSIILRNEVVKGLTTAASMWAVAAIGLAVGGGLYLAAIAATVLILFILAGIKPLEERFRSGRQAVVIQLQAERGSMSVRQLIVQPGETPDVDEVTISLGQHAPKDVDEMVASLSKLPSVIAVKQSQP